MNSMVQATSCESHTHLELSEVDINKVDELVSRISDTDPNTVVEFGRDVTTLTEGCSDEMLAHATPEDLEHMGKKLTEVVVIAKTLNCQGFDSKSTVPVIGSLINRFRLTKEKYVAQFMTTKEQMEAIVEEVVETNGKLSQRNVELEKMYNAVRAEYHLLELHIVAGKKKLGQLHQSISERSNLVSNGDETQLLNDMHNQANFLEKRVQDLLALQQLALLTLPSIRLIQSNNSMLSDKFQNNKLIRIWNIRKTLSTV